MSDSERSELMKKMDKDLEEHFRCDSKPLTFFRIFPKLKNIFLFTRLLGTYIKTFLLIFEH